MKSVDVRELRQKARALVRDVERGETIQLTDRGRPVARLTPLPAAGPSSASTVLARLRADDR